jgi:hypothetical protein
MKKLAVSIAFSFLCAIFLSYAEMENRHGRFSRKKVRRPTTSQRYW